MVGSDATCHGAPFSESTGPVLRLTIQRGPQEGTVIACRRVVTLIGSRAGCKVHLDHPLVSPVHVALVNDGGEVYAVDLVSKRGTLLNDLKMEHERLSDGDLLTIDPWVFRVGLGRGAPGDNGHAPSFALEFAPHLIAFEHIESGRILRPNRRVCTVGRRSGCDIQVDDAGVSRAHAIFFVHGEHPAVVDLLSRNGTCVNDEPVQFLALRDQDVVQVGDARFRVRVILPSAGAPTTKSADQVARPGTAPPSPGANGAGPLIEHKDDLIDIQAVEGAQRWRVAEQIEQPVRERRVAP